MGPGNHVPKVPVAAPYFAGKRSTQLDAMMWDQYIMDMLKGKIMEAISLVNPSSQLGLASNYEPEIEAILRYLLFRFTLYASAGATYGSTLENLTYKPFERSPQNQRQGETGLLRSIPAVSWRMQDDKRRKLMHLILVVVVPYAWRKWREHALSNQWNDTEANQEGTGMAWKNRVWDWMNRMHDSYMALRFINHLVFLYNGTYRSIVERILGLKLIVKDPSKKRYVDYTYLNRQLVWQSFTDFTLFVVPLIQESRLWSNIRSFIKKRPSIDVPVTAIQGSYDGCPLCQCQKEMIVSPHYLEPCGHVFCYYCIASYRDTYQDHSSASDFSCPVCHVQVGEFILLEREGNGDNLALDL